MRDPENDDRFQILRHSFLYLYPKTLFRYTTDRSVFSFYGLKFSNVGCNERFFTNFFDSTEEYGGVILIPDRQCVVFENRKKLLSQSTLTKSTGNKGDGLSLH